MNDPSALDLIFASLSEPDTDPQPAQSAAPSGPDQSAANSAEAARDQVGQLLDSLRGPELRARFQELLDQLAGASFGSYQENAALAQQVNAVAAALGINFVSADEQRVKLRCINPPRSKTGSFQLRTADRKQKTVYSGGTLPPLRAAAI